MSSPSTTTSSSKSSGFQQSLDAFSQILQRLSGGTSSGLTSATGVGTQTGATTGTTTGATTGTTLSPYAAPLANQGQMLSNISAPTLKLYGAQTAEALRTGGVNAQIPIINRSTDAARSALSGSTSQLRENLSRSGLGNTAFGQALLNQNTATGNENIASIGPTAASQFIAGAPSFGTSVAGAGTGALSAAEAGNIATTGTSTGTQTGTTTGRSTTQFNTAQQQAYQDFINQLLSGGSINQGGFSGVNAGTSTSTPSFWDLFSQALGPLSLIGSAAGGGAAASGGP